MPLQNFDTYRSLNAAASRGFHSNLALLRTLALELHTFRIFSRSNSWHWQPVPAATGHCTEGVRYWADGGRPTSWHKNSNIVENKKPMADSLTDPPVPHPYVGSVPIESDGRCLGSEKRRP